MYRLTGQGSRDSEREDCNKSKISFQHKYKVNLWVEVHEQLIKSVVEQKVKTGEAKQMDVISAIATLVANPKDIAAENIARYQRILQLINTKSGNYDNLVEDIADQASFQAMTKMKTTIKQAYKVLTSAEQKAVVEKVRRVQKTRPDELSRPQL